MRKIIVFSFLSFLSVNLYAQFNPDYLNWRYLDNMPLREYNEWAGNRTICSLELRRGMSSLTNDAFDLVEFFQIEDIYGNDTRDDNDFWEYIFRNYSTIIRATLSPGDVNIFFASVRYFRDEDMTAGYFLVSRYNGGNTNNSDSYRIFLYAYVIQWY